MATLEEVYGNVISDEGQRKAFIQVVGDEQAMAAFLKERGCEATAEEVKTFLDERRLKADELSDGELSSVSGGCGRGTYCSKCKSYNLKVTHDAYICQDCGEVCYRVWVNE